METNYLNMDVENVLFETHTYIYAHRHIDCIRQKWMCIKIVRCTSLVSADGVNVGWSVLLVHSFRFSILAWLFIHWPKARKVQQMTFCFNTHAKINHFWFYVVFFVDVFPSDLCFCCFIFSFQSHRCICVAIMLYYSISSHPSCFIITLATNGFCAFDIQSAVKLVDDLIIFFFHPPRLKFTSNNIKYVVE